MKRTPPPLAGCALLALSATAFADSVTAPTLDFIRYVAPATPPAVSQDATGGSAVVAFTVDAGGEILDAVALSASDRRFADAMVRTVEQWQLSPADHAAPRRELVEFIFQHDGFLRTLAHLDGARSAFPQDGARALRTLRRDELTSAPTRAPVADRTARRIARSVPGGGRATVSYIIDEQGQVRVPMVLYADSPEAAKAALALAETWRYVPVHHDGVPVQVEERQREPLPYLRSVAETQASDAASCGSPDEP